MKHINRRLEAFSFLLYLRCIERIHNGFTTESQRTHLVTAITQHPSPITRMTSAKLLILSHIQKNASKKMQIYPNFLRKALMISKL